MTIEPAYSFVLWAIPRFHRANAAQSELPPSPRNKPAPRRRPRMICFEKKQPLFEKSGAKTFRMLGQGQCR